MTQKRLNQSLRESTDVNMTPLIDVSLVLVVILMLATPLAFESSIGVRNATKRAKVASNSEHVEVVEVQVVSEDSVRVNRSTVARDALSATLRPLLEASVTGRVVVACAAGVSHGAFVDALDASKLSGASEIAVIGR